MIWQIKGCGIGSLDCSFGADACRDNRLVTQ